MKIKAILCDLDGTLLRMEEKDFINHYLSRLCRVMEPFGYKGEEMVAAMWKGVDALINSDGTQNNHDTFWQTFSSILGPETLTHEDKFDDFYRQGDFHQTKEITKPNPQAKVFIEELKKQNIRVILATNPLFPACAVQTRLGWIDLCLDDFELVTTYENCRYCKPSVHYYEDILQTAGLSPSECIMIGNSVTEDIVPAKALGIDTFLITEYASGDTSLAKNQGTFADMQAFVKDKISLS
ncbi:MAG: HAD family hydrolase [Clostridiales bacterium]|nr:HAD family hydrolase [Clostridiales bacterium]